MSDIKFGDIWQTLSTIDCKGHTEKKDVGIGRKLTYLSWTWAWGITMKHYPSATYTVREWDGKPYMLDPVAGVLVMTEIDIGGNKRPMWLPVMDGANNAMKAEPYTYQVRGRDGRPFDKRVAAVDMCAINKAIMRCLVKNLAMFGLGLNIYAGEDLPVGADPEEAKAAPSEPTVAETPQKAPNPAPAARVNVRRITASPKAKEAWRAFNALPGCRGQNAKQIADAWKKLVSEELGGDFTSSEKVTDEEWDKVLNRISVESCM